jgi:hypothetical protein
LSTGRHFTRYNALIDNGWLRVLTPIEKDVWHIFNRHGSTTAEAFPGPKRIGDLIGHAGPSHIRAARARLVEYGLLTKINDGGGDEVAIYRVETPGIAPGYPAPKTSRVGKRAGSKSGRAPCPDSGANPTPIQHSLYKDEGNTKGLKEGKAAAPTFPRTLDTPEFREAWCEWAKHRKEIRQTLTPTTTTKQLEALASVGVTAAIKTIQLSITNGWRGLFPRKGSTNGHAHPDRAGDFKRADRPSLRILAGSAQA